MQSIANFKQRKEIELTSADPVEPKPKQSAAAGFFMFILLMLLLATCATLVSDKSEKKVDPEIKEKGMHCLSVLNGHHDEFNDAVKKSLNDPSSFDPYETRIGRRRDNDRHIVLLKFRAKNAFGGVVPASATAVINHVNCGLLYWSMDK